MHPDHPDLMYPLSGLLIQIHIQMYPQSLVVFNDFVVVVVFVVIVFVVVVFVVSVVVCLLCQCLRCRCLCYRCLL